MNNPECMDWIEKQNELTSKVLNKAASKYNSYHSIERYAHVNYDNPQRHGDYYFTYAFYDKISLPALFVQSSLKSDPTLLVDPNFISFKDNISIRDYATSHDSKYLAYQFSRNGSDLGEIKVVNIKTGIHKKDHLLNIKFSSIYWKDNGFYYSTFRGHAMEKTEGQELYYHQLDTEQSEDKLVFKRSSNPNVIFEVQTTSDERFLILKEIDEAKHLINFFYIDFQSQSPALLPMLTKLSFKDDLTILDNQGDDLIALSKKDVNNGMIVRINLSNPREWKVLIPEYSAALLLEVKLLEDKIISVYQSNRKQQIVFFDYLGKELSAISLPFGFSVSGFNGNRTDKKLLFSYEGYTQPKVVYILDTETFEMKPLSTTMVNFDYTLYETAELEFESFDGTKVPLSMVSKKGINLKGNNPTLLKAYGGFGIIDEPAYNPGIVHFLNEGGVFVFANIRGGGDKGKNWTKQGRGKNINNSFRDFIAAAEYLVREGYTSPDKLAITGGSNGGLVVGVAMTQRPDLLKVAVPVVAPLDMIRFENFTVGHWHTDEYGSVKDSSGFNMIFSYSPLHNIKDSVNYPATLIMTSEYDDRVPPLHSYKFAAKLQNRSSQTNPILLRVEMGAGHSGANSSRKRLLKQEAAKYDFILYYLKLN
jgi:prolyl oligopeptidase